MPTILFSPAQRELPTVSFFGRTLDEYTRFFSLDPARLRGRAVLDVAAGPSSFTAESCRRGIDAVAVDPLYDCPAGALTARIRDDYERMLGQIRAKPQMFRLTTFASLAEAETDRRAAAQRFLADFEANPRHGRYVRGALPTLPFLDGAFHLVLCAHLLFIHGGRFDLAWHLAACVELIRVSSGEARIHPICGADGRPWPKLNQLRRELRARGIVARVVPVDYEFFTGSSSMLVLTRVPPSVPPGQGFVNPAILPTGPAGMVPAQPDSCGLVRKTRFGP